MRRLPHAKVLLVLISSFLCWVDYALEGSTFSLSKCEVIAHVSIYCGFVSGRLDLPSDARAFSLTSFEA